MEVQAQTEGHISVYIGPCLINSLLERYRFLVDQNAGSAEGSGEAIYYAFAPCIGTLVEQLSSLEVRAMMLCFNTRMIH